MEATQKEKNTTRREIEALIKASYRMASDATALENGGTWQYLEQSSLAQITVVVLDHCLRKGITATELSTQ